MEVATNNIGMYSNNMLIDEYNKDIDIKEYYYVNIIQDQVIRSKELIDYIRNDRYIIISYNKIKNISSNMLFNQGISKKICPICDKTLDALNYCGKCHRIIKQKDILNKPFKSIIRSVSTYARKIISHDQITDFLLSVENKTHQALYILKYLTATPNTNLFGSPDHKIKIKDITFIKPTDTQFVFFENRKYGIDQYRVIDAEHDLILLDILKKYLKDKNDNDLFYKFSNKNFINKRVPTKLHLSDFKANRIDHLFKIYKYELLDLNEFLYEYDFKTVVKIFYLHNPHLTRRNRIKTKIKKLLSTSK